MVAKLLDFLHGLVEISNQSMGQLHLVGKASNAIVTFHGQHHSFNSSGSAREVTVL
jgi:hypothetical protein